MQYLIAKLPLVQVPFSKRLQRTVFQVPACHNTSIKCVVANILDALFNKSKKILNFVHVCVYNHI